MIQMMIQNRKLYSKTVKYVFKVVRYVLRLKNKLQGCKISWKVVKYIVRCKINGKVVKYMV